MRLPTSKYWSEAEGRAVIEAWRRSGETAPVFARRHGLRSNRIKYWAGRLSRPEEPAPTLALVPATVVGAELAVVIRIGEVTIELSSAAPAQIAAIAQALARPTP
jgi:hypothetical protein